MAIPILSVGGLLAFGSVLIPGAVSPTWWARSTMVAMGVAALTAGVVAARRPLSAGWLFVIAVGADLAIVAGAAGLRVDYKTGQTFFALTAVVVALYGTRRMIFAHVPIVVLGCVASQLFFGADAATTAFQAVALSFATLSPSAAVVALRRRLEVAVDQAQRQAATDPLTRVANRRGLDEGMPALLQRHERTGLPLGVVVVDVDHFKRVNDAFGHAAGDEVIQQVSAAVRSCVRSEDLVARLGGEEFAVIVLLPPDDLTALAERIRRQISEHCADRSVTASVGVTWSSPGVIWDGDDPGRIWRLVDHADALMYQAKGLGRNRVCVGVPAASV